MSNSEANNKIRVGDYSLTNEDVFLVGDAEIDDKGLVHHHISSVNDLYGIGIPQIITQVFKLEFVIKDIRRNTPEEENIDHVIVKINFSDVNINKPTMINYSSGKEEILFPSVALLKEKTYKSTLRVNVNIEAIAVLKNGNNIVKKNTVKNFKLCKIPIMVKSNWCNTHNLTKENLNQLHEDPTDPGGYFIIKGVEWVIDCVENILFNKIRIFKNEGYGKEIMRAEFISKPGDFYLNSDQFIIRWLNDGQITIEIKREKMKDIHIPFYLVYRILGWNTDKQIFDNILLGKNNPTSKNMNNFLTNAFNVKYSNLSKGKHIYSQMETLRFFAEEVKDKSFSYLDVDKIPENYQKITQFILENFDIHFLQHLGTDMESRDIKLRFLSLMIRKMFLVKLGNMEQTDRDSYNSKRIHAAGTNYAKSFKTYFNASIIQQITRKLTKDFKSLSFYQIDLPASIKASVYGADFEKSITQAITAGNKSQITVSKRVRINRLSSQLLNRKNQLNVYSTLRQVTATSSDSAKQSERASEMRRVHLSFLGYICVSHSPEGEKVGINKQLALFATVTKASISEVIKDILLDDDDIFPLNTINYEDISQKELSNVFVNGNWIGCCKDALEIAKKYRQKRRKFEISPEITIIWDNTQDEVYFWTDVGRVIRPLLIVYNNRRDPEVFSQSERKSDKFIQGIALTKNHVNNLYEKKITIEDLLKQNIIEYISAGEQENMLLSPSYEHLRENKHNELMEYTHCDIPQAMLGLTALTSPFANHNQTPRLTYQTSQSKQTCGVPAQNWPYRADKDTFLQYNCEMPLVKTISSRYLYPNGSNCIVAIMINGGFNN
jgi:DNA-directed RNA polymerase II subunit RPB2